MKMTVVTLLFLLFLWGCQDDGIPEGTLLKTPPPVNPILRNKIETAKSFGDLFTLKRTVHLETSKESLIGTVETLDYLPDRKMFLIFDQATTKTIFLFDDKGKFLTKIGRKGKGPGEITDPYAVAFDHNRIVVYCWPPPRLLFFTFEGTYLEEISFMEKDWDFNPGKMVLWKNDLYVYTNDPYRRTSPDGKEYRVFKLKNAHRFDRAFGKPEETFDFGEGSIIVCNDNLLYTGIFDGNIYRIDPSSNTHSIFCALGSLTDVGKIKTSQNHLQYIMTHIKDLDSMVRLSALDNVLFLERHKMMTLIDLSGKIIRKDLPKEIHLPQDFDSYASRRGFSFYDKGIIVIANLKSGLSETNVPNPSLIIYELNTPSEN